MARTKKKLGNPPSAFTFENGLKIYPRLPIYDGIFHLGPNTLIASHSPHMHVEEHLHDHLPHLHIRYGFEIPRQSFDGVGRRGAALQVAMLIRHGQRVDCNPVFAGKGDGAEGVCLKIANEDVHWVHDEKVSKKAARLYRGTGRKLSKEGRFIGFSTSDLEEREIQRYSRQELIAAVGGGLRVDQHFQATWIDPCDKKIEPYEVTICLSDDATKFHTFFTLQPTVSIGAF